MAANIPISVRHCLDQFKGLQTANDFESSDSNDYNIKNELDRFKIWVGNLAAHRPLGKRSLEFRLRDAEDLRSSVLELLSNLSNALERYTIPEPGEESLDSDDDDELGFEYDELATQPPNALRDIHDTINLLYQFSATLRNPARQNRLKEGLMSMRPYYSEVYIKLVQDKFADAPQYLSERLGGAISSRRQYFKYREDHKISMSAGLDDVVEGRSTVASSIPKAVEYVHDVEETESTYSMTSYAPTESETSDLRPPALPEAGRNGDPFECPICYSIVQVTGEASWKRHFFEDLAPYLCTRADCRLGNKMYSRRRDWQRHETHMHNRIWICPFGCGAEYRSAEDLNPHLAKTHGHSNEGGRSTRMAHSLSRPTDIPFDLKCPLCKKVTASSILWFKHVARHMEQLALQAVDSHKLAADSDEEDVDALDRVSEDVARSQGSSMRDDDADPDDPAEPKYCYCNRGSYGDMIACDNKSCPREWFHLGCTELHRLPGEQETWYCRVCHPLFGQQSDENGKAGAQLLREQDNNAIFKIPLRREPIDGGADVPDADPSVEALGFKTLSTAIHAANSNRERPARGNDDEEALEEVADNALENPSPSKLAAGQTEGDADETRLHPYTIDAMEQWARRRKGQDEEPLPQTSSRSNCIERRDPRDEVHAATGLTESQLAETIVPDYSKSMEEVYVDAMDTVSDANKRSREEELAENDARELKYQEFLQQIRAREENKKREEKEAEERFQNEMRKRLRNLGYTEETIDIMVDEEKAKEFKKTGQKADTLGTPQLPRVPVYPKVHRDYIEIDTLKYYDLPWQYDSNDPDYVVIMRDMDKRETDTLFEHTSRLRSGKLLLEPAKKGEKQFAFYRKRPKSRSGRPEEPESLRRD